MWFAVPPSGYGGIEWVVSLLADGLTAAGHDVTLFASGDSRSKATISSVYPEAPSALIGRTQPDLCHAGGILECKKIAAMAECYFASVAPHNPLGPISLAACLQLDACIPNFLVQ